MQSVINLAGAAMRVYDKVVHEQVFTKNVLFMNVLKNIAHTTGSTTKYFSVHNGRNTGSAAGTETLTLPTAGNQKYTQANIPMKYNFHTVALTDVALTASRKSKEFLVNVLESEYNGAKDDMQRQLSRQGYSFGTGEIAKIAGDPGAGTTVTLDNPMIGENPTDYIEVGNILRFGATASTIATVDSITSNTVFEIDAAVAAIADDDAVYIAQSATQSNKDNEMMGLKGLIDDGTYVATLENIARASNIWWKSYVSSNSGTLRNLSDALLHTAYLAAMKKGMPKYALTSFQCYSTYGQTLTPDRRYTSAMKLAGGFTGIAFNELPIVPDFDCPVSNLFFVDPSVLSVEDLAPMSFLKEDGAILDRSATTPAWNATLKYYANLAIKAPNKCSVIRDIQ